jgi:hypothetical protein
MDASFMGDPQDRVALLARPLDLCGGRCSGRSRPGERTLSFDEELAENGHIRGHCVWCFGCILPRPPKLAPGKRAGPTADSACHRLGSRDDGAVRIPGVDLHRGKRHREPEHAALTLDTPGDETDGISVWSDLLRDLWTRGLRLVGTTAHEEETCANQSRSEQVSALCVDQ